jgi:hypothetical protein
MACGLSHLLPHEPRKRAFTISSKHKNPIISFRITNAEREQIEAWILASGMIETAMKNNTLNYQFGMYDSSTNSIIVNAGEHSVLIIRYQEYNKGVVLSDPNDIAYLYWLAQDTPLLYAELALKENGLQGYVDAMNEFN